MRLLHDEGRKKERGHAESQEYIHTGYHSDDYADILHQCPFASFSFSAPRCHSSTIVVPTRTRPCRARKRCATGATRSSVRPPGLTRIMTGVGTVFFRSLGHVSLMMAEKTPAALRTPLARPLYPSPSVEPANRRHQSGRLPRRAWQPDLPPSGSQPDPVRRPVPFAGHASRPRVRAVSYTVADGSATGSSPLG